MKHKLFILVMVTIVLFEAIGCSSVENQEGELIELTVLNIKCTRRHPIVGIYYMESEYKNEKYKTKINLRNADSDLKHALRYNELKNGDKIYGYKILDNQGIPYITNTSLRK